MKWSNVAAWLLSIASLAFAAHPTLAKGLDKQVPKGARPIARVAKPAASGACVLANFTVSKPAFYYQNTTSISLMKSDSKKLPPASVATDPASRQEFTCQYDIGADYLDARAARSLPGNATATAVSLVSGTDGLLANALWGSIATAGLNAPESFNPQVQAKK